MLRSRAQEASSDFRVDMIGGVVLIDASGTLDGGMVQRLGDHLEQLRAGSRPFVLDLTRVSAVDPEAVAMLRAAWRDVGDELRVVAAPGGAPARALKAGRIRRFAVHATLSGALADAAPH